MLDLILKAVATGFVLSIMIGPVFFLLLETSIRKGVRAALAFDFGVFLSDLIYIIVATIFYSSVAKLTNGEDKYLVKIFGGLIFVIFGTITLIKKPQKGTRDDALNAQAAKDYLMLCLKGFFLNFVNPAVIFYWFSVIAIGAENKGSGDLGDHIYIYIGILLATFFAVDVLKIIGAKKLRPFITDKVLTGLNRLTGLIIFCTGIYLFTDGILYAIKHWETL